MIRINIAVEDVLSEAVLRRLVGDVRKDLAIHVALQKNGNAYLRARTPEFNRAAAGCGFIILTDQDTEENCPPNLIRSWLRGAEQHPNLMLRVAVMEIEAWLLADRKAFSDFFDVPINRLPNDLETVPDPKQFLIGLARRSSSSSIRSAVVPREGLTASVGPDYNGTLLSFTQTAWDPMRAKRHADSLDRAIRRLQTFRPPAV